VRSAFHIHVAIRHGAGCTLGFSARNLLTHIGWTELQFRGVTAAVSATLVPRCPATLDFRMVGTNRKRRSETVLGSLSHTSAVVINQNPFPRAASTRHGSIATFPSSEPMQGDPPCSWADFLSPKLCRCPYDVQTLVWQEYLRNGAEGCVLTIKLGDGCGLGPLALKMVGGSSRQPNS
jgi:hypothetical protein